MTRRHLPCGWACGGLSGPELTAAAGPVSCPPALSDVTTWLLSVGLFKISSMEKDSPSFLGASQHPELLLSIPCRGQGLPWGTQWVAVRRGRRGPCVRPGRSWGRVAYFLPWNFWNQKGKRRLSTGSLMSDYPSTILSLHGLPWAILTAPPKRQVTLGELEWAVSQAPGLRALADLMSREPAWPRWVWLYCQRSSPGGCFQNPWARSESLMSLPSKLKSWKEEERPRLSFLWLVALA